MSSADKNRRLRDVFGCFATGVCVVTTAGADGEPIGMTVNSFCSVSLDPALISWCVGRDASCFAAFAGAQPFNVHILAADQAALSQAFATRDGTPFEAVDWSRDARGIPVLEVCPVRLACVPREHIDAGDHVLIIAAVGDYTIADQEPLLFYRSAYRGL